MKISDFPQDLEPRVGDIIEIEQGDVCFEVRIIGITADGYLCEQDNVEGAVLLEGVALDQDDVTDIAGYITEERVRLDPKCWKGKKIGNPKTKLKGGVRVNNCVPEGQQEVAESTEQSLRKKIQAKRDALGLAREQRRVRGQHQQGQREIKLQAEIDELSNQLTQIKKQDVAEAGIDPTLGPRGRDRDMRRIDPGPEEKYYFQVPFELKTLAKDMGLRWDPDKKKWFTTSILTKTQAERKFKPWKGVAEMEGYKKTFTVVYYSPKTDRNVSKIIRAKNESDIWDQFKAKGIDVVSVKEKSVAEGSDVAHWRVEQSYATGRYYVVTGYTDKTRRVWKSKQGAADFSKKSDAEAKAQELNQGVAEGSEKKDMTGQTCEKCKKDKYQERSWNDDRNGTLQCSCGHVVDRWRKYKKKDEQQGVAEGSDNNVYFEVDSEKAYNHIMKKFRSVINWDGDTMVAPKKYWGAIQELAYSAGGEAIEVGNEQGVAEGKPKQLPTKGADYSQYDTDHLRTLLKPGILHRNEARFKALIRKELQKREQQGVAEGSRDKVHLKTPKHGLADHPGRDTGVGLRTFAQTPEQDRCPKCNSLFKNHYKQGVAEGSLNELDTSTLKSYRGKANDEVNAIKQKQELGQLSDKDFFKKQDRLMGITRASKRIDKRGIIGVKEGQVRFVSVEQGVAEGYTGRETKDGTWRVFKDGQAVAVAGPFNSRDEAHAWIKKHKQGVSEAKSLKKRVRVVQGEHAGKTGWIREIKHGVHSTAPKRYYVDIDGGGQADNLPASALRLLKDQSDGQKNMAEGEMTEAEYQGRKVALGKPMAGDVKKSKVYVRKPNGKVVKVNFGDKTMKIKKSNPNRRKSFRARHNCENPGPRWRARYWSCRAW